MTFDLSGLFETPILHLGLSAPTYVPNISAVGQSMTKRIAGQTHRSPSFGSIDLSSDFISKQILEALSKIWKWVEKLISSPDGPTLQRRFCQGVTTTNYRPVHNALVAHYHTWKWILLKEWWLLNRNSTSLCLSCERYKRAYFQNSVAPNRNQTDVTALCKNPCSHVTETWYIKDLVLQVQIPAFIYFWPILEAF